MKIASWFVAVALPVASVACQDLPILTPSRPLIVECSHGSIFLDGPDQPGATNSELTWIRYGATSEIVANLPFKELRSVEHISDTHLLVSGLAPDDKGRLCLVKLDPTTATVEILRTEDIGPIVPAAFAWNRAMGCLAIYDFASGSLFLAPFSGVGLPRTHELVLIGCDADVPNLAGDMVHLGSTQGGFFVKYDRLAPSGHYLLKDNAWRFGFQNWNWAAMWRVDPGSVEGHGGPVRVMGAGTGFEPPQDFEIRMEGVPLGAASRVVATQSAGDEWVEVFAPREFYDYPGAEFTIASISGEAVQTSLGFWPLVRHGTPHTSGDSFRLVRGKVAASRLNERADVMPDHPTESSW